MDALDKRFNKGKRVGKIAVENRVLERIINKGA